MYAGLEAILTGIGRQYDSVLEAQVSVGLNGIALARADLTLNEEWTLTYEGWGNRIFIDTLSIQGEDKAQDPAVVPDNPFYQPDAQGSGSPMGTIVSQDQLWLSADQQQGNGEIMGLNNLVEKTKSMVEFLGNALTETMAQASPVWSLINLAKSLSGSF